MKVKIPYLILTGLFSATVASQGATVMTTLNQTDVEALVGSSSGNFNQAFSDSGITVTLNFAFTATNGNFNRSSARLGIDGSVDEGNAGETSFDGAEALGLTVSFVSSSVPLATLDFGVSNIAIYRSDLSPGTVSYEWVSSLGTAQVIATTLDAAATPDVGDATSNWDLLSGNYTATFREIESTGVETAPRFGTDGIEVTLNFTEPVPEPSSTALIGLGGLALLLRRRK